MRIVADKDKRIIEVKVSTFMTKKEKEAYEINLKHFKRANPYSSKSALLRHLFLEVLADKDKIESIGFKYEFSLE